MRTWLYRGLGMGLLHAAVQTALAAVRLRLPEHGEAFQALALLVLIAAGVAWGFRDFRRGTAGVSDLGGRWLRAGGVAGVSAGLLATVAQAILIDASGASALPVALTGGAAFTALLVVATVLCGAVLARRRGTPAETGSRPRPTPWPRTRSGERNSTASRVPDETAAERTTPLTRVRGRRRPASAVDSLSGGPWLGGLGVRGIVGFLPGDPVPRGVHGADQLIGELGRLG